MILTIDTTDRNKIEIGLFDGKIHRCFEFITEKPHFVPQGGTSRGKQSEDLLIAIDGILKQQKSSLKNLQAILVNRGPGSFTGIRVGVTTVNTLGWVLNIPVFSFSSKDFDQSLLKVEKSNIKEFLKPVFPYYSKSL